MTIQEKNEKLALFDGFKHYNDAIEEYPNGYFMHENDGGPFTSFMYDESWDWLMPVVEKIVAIGTYDYFPMGTRITSRPDFRISIREIEIYFHSKTIDYKEGIHIVVNQRGEGYKHSMYGTNLFIKFDFNKDSLILAVFEAVYAFIEWYDKNKKQ